MAAPGLNVIGCGRAARTLAAIWQRTAVLETIAILNRSAESAVAAAGFVGAGKAVSDLSQMAAAEFWMIGVGDDRISGVADALAASGLLRPGDIVFHLSGAHGSDKLASCRDAGARCASLHPAHSFADPGRSLSAIAGCRCVVEGDSTAIDALRPLVVALEAVLLEIDPAQKIVYHAGMVFASNYVVALLGDALTAVGAAGIPDSEAAELLRPLLLGSAANALEYGVEDALTGPIARGDATLVAAQLEALERVLPGVAARYRALGLAASAIARRADSADLEALARIEALLGRERG